MTYNPAIPQPGDIPSQSQQKLLTNFFELNAQFQVEHNAFDSATHDGKHKFVTLQRGAGPGPAGTDVILSQSTMGSGNPYLKYQDTSTFYGIPQVFSAVGIIASGTHAIYDFAAVPLRSTMGVILIYCPPANAHNLLCMYTWSGGVLNIPPQSQQLHGSTFTQVTAAGSVLSLTNASGGALQFYLKVMGSVI
jgi:hypothetical protein